MITVKMNKNFKSIYKRYLDSELYSLHDLYKYFSVYKMQAWRYCENLLKNYNGHNLKIIGGNSQLFSAGFTCEINGIKNFVYITASHDRIMEILED